MPIPTTRAALIHQVTSSFAALQRLLDEAGPRIGTVPCVDGWRVKDLLAVRAWWTERVVEWIEAGRRGESPIVPAPGYRWTETPRLNAAIVRAARRQSYRRIRARLDRGVARALAAIDALDDRELLRVGAFTWTGKWPISRWISINTARQYTTARQFIRRAYRGCGRQETTAPAPRSGPASPASRR